MLERMAQVLRDHPEIALFLTFGVGYCAAIEIIQSTPWIGRDAELFDWFADAAGLAAAYGLKRAVSGFKA